MQPEFWAWLSDPAKNGGGALFDFGCYGANLMTWLMDNQPPLKVTALTQTDKPDIYAHVDDEATVLLEYPKAQGIIQASWNWPVGRKDFEVYGAHGYAIATGGDNLRVRLPDAQADETRTLPELKPQEADSISYLIGVARGKFKPSGLSSLENNMIVIEILDAARESGGRLRLAGECASSDAQRRVLSSAAPQPDRPPRSGPAIPRAAPKAWPRAPTRPRHLARVRAELPDVAAARRPYASRCLRHRLVSHHGLAGHREALAYLAHGWPAAAVRLQRWRGKRGPARAE